MGLASGGDLELLSELNMGMAVFGGTAISQLVNDSYTGVELEELLA